jgi:hypothetical protein
MPTEVFDLSPQQLDWLYEHQTLKSADALHHLDLLSSGDSSPNVSPTCYRPSQIVDFGRDASMPGMDGSYTSHTTFNSAASPPRNSPDLVVESINFPFTCERPTWEQSLANLLCYKDYHGVSVNMRQKYSSMRKTHRGARTHMHACTHARTKWTHHILSFYSVDCQHCNVPRFYPTYRQLGSWVHRQRLKKKFPNKYGALKPEQVEKLEKVGFIWRVRKDSSR